MAACYFSRVTEEVVYGTTLYSVYFYSYTSEGGPQTEGYIHGLTSAMEAAHMCSFYETGGHKLALLFMGCSLGPYYTPEEIEAMEDENYRLEALYAE